MVDRGVRFYGRKHNKRNEDEDSVVRHGHEAVHQGTAIVARIEKTSVDVQRQESSVQRHVQMQASGDVWIVLLPVNKVRRMADEEDEQSNDRVEE